MASEGAAVGSANGASKVAIAAFKPQLVVPAQKADAAVQFYKAAFGAEELKRATHPKRKADHETPLILCAELEIGGSSLLVCDQTDDSAAESKDGTGMGGILLRLEAVDVKGAIQKAVSAGAAQVGEIAEDEGPCGGGLVGKVKDPFGVVWIVASVSKACGGEAEA